MALTKIKTSNLETSIDLTGINDTATSQILTVSDTGIDVTGTVTADGLIVDGTSTLSATDSATNTVTTGLKVGHNTSGTTANGFGSALEFEAENSTYSNVNTYAKFESVVTDQIAIHSDLNVYTKYNNSLKKRMSFNDNGDINFYEDTGTTAKFFWDASAESLGIGATSAYRNGKLVVKAASVSQTSTTANLHISTTDSQAANLGGSIGLGGQIGGDETPFGYISGRKENSTSGNYAGYLAFATQDSTASVAERMRIDSSGNLLVGTTSTDLNANQGQKLTGQQLWSTRTSAASAYFNRLTSDGEIVVFKKDGTNVGFIGAYSGEMYIASTAGTDAGLRLGYDTVVPATTAGVNRDAAINLGASNGRFQDAYLSGGVYLGGTGAANKLDDYEEGVYQYTITGSTGGSMTPRSNYQYFSYTKIGRQVTVIGKFETSGSHNATGALRWSLPFAIGNFYDQSEAAGGTLFLYRTGLANVYNPTLSSYGGVSFFYSYYNTISNNEPVTLEGGNVDSNIEGFVHFTYFTD